MRIAESLAKNAREKKMAKDKSVIIANERYIDLVKILAQPKFRALYVAVARDRLSHDLLEELAALAPRRRPCSHP
ncbi:hypothetical protein H2248_004224 [Termitomyces sp. 'cryptogamus']|nr:hypothetical protein H2248_004224 [Termitomyces sp. 'cryptogamus']